MTVQAHADAILALLRADASLTVYPDASGKIPAGAAPPYVRVYMHVERPLGPTMDMVSSRVVARAICHSVGANDIAARAVAQRVAARLLDVRPVIAGRTAWPIRHEQNQPPARDESTGTVVIDQVDVYRLETLPG
jgi:hypothetical protein